MGKGDKRTGRGKIFKGSFGNSRKRVKKGGVNIPPTKTPAKKSGK